MQLFIVVAVTLVFWGTSSAEEFNRAELYNFFKCVACVKDPTGRNEFADVCGEQKPEITKKLTEDCQAKFMPSATTREELWATFCKNENNAGDRTFNCIYGPDSMKDFNEEDKTQFGKFMQCYKNLNKKYCNAQ